MKRAKVERGEGNSQPNRNAHRVWSVNGNFADAFVLDGGKDGPPITKSQLSLLHSQLAPNAVQAMKAMDPRLQDAYFQIAPKAPVSETDGRKMVIFHKVLTGMDGEDTGNTLKAFEEVHTPHTNNRTHNVHRATFWGEMTKLLPSSFGKELDLDAIIGCDGAKSRVRKIFLAGEHNVGPQFTGKYAYRGLNGMEDAVTATAEQARIPFILCDYGGHLGAFPIDQGNTFNHVAFHGQKEVNGIMVGIGLPQARSKMLLKTARTEVSP
ncbi:uncharacterized protein Z518_02418 [Rhinocladiella mackenziei CBS 650.93]|uniref:Rhinocladiella mackenziei CBS 650.93 unplaced genomic scaffold supercont1.2, whole genome shotgun sequence n=1 Tax=Rhinocladiella mackenziei CBS 650.93 TaxID=1442369 RepID=A0A0D2IPF4_9EURO|nr:uncharacterized protein Z518_02418 [Rhinocladiella mackenziei CBS 650.93]KIX07764.1 hypothetical protein Z518_02418 [Rhinocladiella mackenziei CBS 650.93]